MLTKEVRLGIVKQFQRDEKDTGSAEVQIAIVSKEIELLNEHLKVHTHDFHSKRGLMTKIGRRRAMLQYLKNEDIQRYRNLCDKLGLRR